MKTNLSQAADFAADNKTPSEPTPIRGRRSGRRRSPQSSTPGGPVRFFLSKSESNGTPLLDEEFESEAGAMVESLKTGRSYFVISEWKSCADLSKKLPQIRKECVTPPKKAS
jgi:hypothetical protein